MITLKNILTEDMRNSMPVGFFLAKDNFQLSPGGGWRISIKKDSILQYTETKRLYSWSSLSKDWRLRKPPIQDTETFEPNAYGRGDSMIRMFVQNTKVISKAEAKDLINSATADSVMTVKEALKYLQALGSNQMVKITLVK